ncbi:MAG: hypothetical protein ACXW0J_05455 [Nitrososphaeraceae archaeon]
MDQDTIEEFNNYVNDSEKFQIFDNKSMSENVEYEEQEEGSNRSLGIDEFIAQYSDIFKTSIDIRRSKN